MNGVSYRRRHKVHTPTISTYDKHMRSCERRFNRISLSPTVVLQADLQENQTQNESFTSQMLHRRSSSSLLKDEGFNPHNKLLARRRSSAYIERSKFGRRKSSIRSIPKYQAVISNIHGIQYQDLPQRKTSISLIPINSPYYNNSQTNKPLIDNSIISKNTGTASPSRRKSIIFHSRSSPFNTDQKRDNTHLELLQSLSHHQEYFIRALTTLAINSITSSSNAVPIPQRSVSHNLYDRNVKILLNDYETQQLLQKQLQQRNLDREGTVASSLDKSSPESSDNEDEEVNCSPEDRKRERINKLRHYLKCSGLGEPVMIRVNTEETEESKKQLLRLVRKVHRGLSPEKRERLRLRTHLEYEMSLMKGESFCEEQDQVYMRTASADMEDRDQQLLEEDMKDQLLQDMRKTSWEEHNLDNKHNNNNNQIKFKTDEDRVLARIRDQLFTLKNIQNGNNNNNNNNATKINDADLDLDREYRLLAGRVEKGNNNTDDDRVDGGRVMKMRNNNCLSGNNDDDDDGDGDSASGNLRSPISRRELRKRVFAWVVDVETAMGLEWKEKMRMTYGKSTAEVVNVKQEVWNNESNKETENDDDIMTDAVIGKVRETNEIQEDEILL